MRFIRFLGRRAIYLIPQLLGIVTIVFFLLRLLPGNPAQLIAGVAASDATIAAIEARLGLDEPMHIQYLLYLQNLLKGDMGDSWFTGASVTEDVISRFPATLELITISLLISLVLGIPLGVLIALRPGGPASRLTFFYGLLAGALPDFWVGLILVFFFFFRFDWAPAPFGRLGLLESVPALVTGFYTIDSIIGRNWETLKSALTHLALPVLTLVFVYMGAILKMTVSTMEEMLNSEFIDYARSFGLPRIRIMFYALRNAMPPVVTIIGIIYGFLLGGAVLVEQIFSWGGLGQYAIQSITHADYAPVQGFVLISALFNVIIYLLLDIFYFWLDPRVTT